MYMYHVLNERERSFSGLAERLPVHPVTRLTFDEWSVWSLNTTFLTRLPTAPSRHFVTNLVRLFLCPRLNNVLNALVQDVRYPYATAFENKKTQLNISSSRPLHAILKILSKLLNTRGGVALSPHPCCRMSCKYGLVRIIVPTVLLF